MSPTVSRPPPSGPRVTPESSSLIPAGMVLASFGQRAIAFIVDCFVTGGIMAVGVGLVGVVASASSSAHETAPAWVGLYMVLVMVGCLSYKPMLEGGSGQTVGKRAVGIRVVRAEDGSDVSYGQAFGRTAAQVLDFGVGFLLPLWDSRRQTIHDKAAGTIVVQNV